MDDTVKFIIMGTFAVLGGLFSFFGATRRWKIFMNSRKTRFIVRILGEKGMVIFYQILGILLSLCGIGGLTFGILTLTGMIESGG